MVNAVLILLFVLGAAMGSFACCQAWRIYKKDKTKWSHCMYCKYQLQWYDNIPILSWLFLRGRCRKCRKPIGWAEFLAELGTGAMFALSFAFWPAHDALMALNAVEIVKFVLFLIGLVIMVILFVYDAKWKELPVNLMYVLMGIGAVFCGLSIWQSYTASGTFDWLSLAGAIMILPGFYYLIYKVSHESWVGGGDWMLCVPLALMLGNFWLAMFTLFAANIIGSIISIPMLTFGENRQRMQIAFGPFLIMGFLLIFFLQAQVMALVSF